MLRARMRAVPVEEAQREDVSVEYGAGIYIIEEGDGPSRLGHAGAVYGFLTDLVVIPDERLAAAVLCNHREHDPTGIALGLLDLMATRKSEPRSPTLSLRGSPGSSSDVTA